MNSSNRNSENAATDREDDFTGRLMSGTFSRTLFLRALCYGAAGIGVQKLGFGRGIPVPVANGSPENLSAVAASLKHYYGHDAVLDKHGVIAPWYNQLNGQCDFRIRVAAETMKRYPWTDASKAAVAYPDYLFTSNWSISKEGTITPRHHGDWSNGDLGQRAIAVLDGMTDYYRYSGDAAAIAHITYMGDYVLDFSLTPEDHPWPKFPISVPIKGKAYGKADPAGMIQLDISAAMGEKLLRAYQVTKNQRWLDAAKHWGDLFAEHCNMDGDGPPWPRYANPESVPWQDHPRMNLQTGSVVMILNFLEELMRLGYHGKDGKIPGARNAGVCYLRDQLLPEWWKDKTWACYYWDWIHDMQEVSISAYVSTFMMKHRDEFPNWRTDVRNILLLFIHRATADPKSGGDVYNGAWAYPESSMCCQRSLWYSPLVIAPAMLHYSALSGDEWMKELGYRQMILQTYDIHETGVSEDVIDGGINVNSDWLNIAVPVPLQFIQQAIGWAPEELGPCRENHIVRGTAVVDYIRYAPGNITYSTFDAPEQTMETLRLSFVPSRITADGRRLARRDDLSENGFTVKKLPNGDAIVAIRHDGLRNIEIQGSDPQKTIKHAGLRFEGGWSRTKDNDALSGYLRVSEEKAAVFAADFYGNQVRIIGQADEWGGEADVYIDGKKQLVHIDCWNPALRKQQVLFYTNGLNTGQHSLKLVVRGTANPYSKGKKVYVDSIFFSSESAKHHFPAGTGPTAPQRMIFGYAGEDYKDSKGNLWRPATEVVAPLFKRKDPVAVCWMKRTDAAISGTPDAELYRYGFRSDDFWTNITVGPGKYDLRLLFATTPEEVEYMTGFDILINDKIVVRQFNLPGTAKAMNAAVDLVFNDVEPVNGIVQVRLKGNSTHKVNAFIQALEIGRSLPATGVKPLTYDTKS